MTNTLDLAASAVRVYDIAFNGADLGWVEDVEADVTPVLVERKVQPLLNQVVGHRILGINAKVKMTLKELKIANLGRAFPGYSGSGQVSIAPVAQGADLYDSAKVLLLHPRDMGTDTSQDISLTKAVCTSGLKLKNEAEKDAGIPLEFAAYPDRSLLPAVVLGTIG